jgi:hypothetical protein
MKRFPQIPDLAFACDRHQHGSDNAKQAYFSVGQLDDYIADRSFGHPAKGEGQRSRRIVIEIASRRA